MILLVEDNADDEALTMRALKKNNISNQIVITRDGSRRWIFCSAPVPMPATKPRFPNSFCSI